MPTDRHDEKGHRVDIQAARESASLAVIRNAAAETPGVAGLLKSRIRKVPTTIYDINGSPLFYDFPVSVRGGHGGGVRTAASRILGSPVVALELGSRHWSYNAAVKKLTPKVK